MRLWHDSLIPILDHQRLLGQHRECCALRGKGWGKKHSIVGYVFKHSITLLTLYHYEVMQEMERKKYNVDKIWYNQFYRGKQLRFDGKLPNIGRAEDIELNHFPEHNNEYLKECKQLLLERNYEYYSKYFL